MHDRIKWDIAFVNLANFVRGLSSLPDKGDAGRYHCIIGMFEEVYRQDLSRFKIAPERVKSAGDSGKALQAQGKTQDGKMNSVEAAFFHQRVHELVKYLKSDLFRIATSHGGG
jgi:hypothetical protein